MCYSAAAATHAPMFFAAWETSSTAKGLASQTPSTLAPCNTARDAMKVMSPLPKLQHAPRSSPQSAAQGSAACRTAKPHARQGLSRTAAAEFARTARLASHPWRELRRATSPLLQPVSGIASIQTLVNFSHVLLVLQGGLDSAVPAAMCLQLANLAGGRAPCTWNAAQRMHAS